LCNNNNDNNNNNNNDNSISPLSCSIFSFFPEKYKNQENYNLLFKNRNEKSVLIKEKLDILNKLTKKPLESKK
jgi:hypothetical protein